MHEHVFSLYLVFLFTYLTVCKFLFLFEIYLKKKVYRISSESGIRKFVLINSVTSDENEWRIKKNDGTLRWGTLVA